MKIVKKFLLLVFLLLPLLSGAYEKPVIPNNSKLKYIGNASNMYVFKGEIKLKGLLRAYWDGVDDESDLYLDFVPEGTDRSLLPYINDVYNNKVIILNLNQFPISIRLEETLTSYNADINYKIVKKYFKTIPQGFWQHKKGIITAPATITIKDFAMQVECDSRHYYATTYHIQPIDKTTAIFPSNSSCGSGPSEDVVSVASKDGYTNLRQSPTVKSAILSKIRSGEQITSIEARGNWLYVETKSGVRGYIHKSQVKITN